MTRDRTTERRITDWLVGEGEYELPDRVLDQTFHRAAATRQLRALPGWRMFLMDRKFISFAAGAAAIAVVVIAGAAYFGQPDASNVGGAPTPSATPTPEASAAASPQPSFVAPGITGWKTYTSDVYGLTLSYPEDWFVSGRATRTFQPGDPPDGMDGPWADVFLNPEEVDGETIAMSLLQLPAPAGADVKSWEGLQAALQEMCAKPTEFAYIPCPGEDPPMPMCLGDQECRPAIIALVSDEQTPSAAFGDPETGIVTLVAMGREDLFPAAARYGGTVQLLKSILTQMDVRDPQPGETPH